jgi:hypothetical protein
MPSRQTPRKGRAAFDGPVETDMLAGAARIAGTGARRVPAGLCSRYLGECVMAKLDDEKIVAAFQPYLEADETLKHWAFSVKQPNIFLIILLFLLAILPGIIAVFMLTKNYVVGLTERRLLVLQIKGIGNGEVKEVTEYRIDELANMAVKTSTGAIFTHIAIKDPEKPFVAKFHRAFSKSNRPHAVAISEAISAPA